jgi:hypothetical protein
MSKGTRSETSQVEDTLKGNFRHVAVQMSHRTRHMLCIHGSQLSLPHSAMLPHQHRLVRQNTTRDKPFSAAFNGQP